MMIAVRTRRGDEIYYINTDLVESILEREGNTSEIRCINGHFYTSIESPQTLSERISKAQLSELRD